jgi:hypothetical protein
MKVSLTSARFSCSAGIAMTYIEPKKFYWLPTPSAWDDAQSWRDRRRAMVDQFQSDSTNALASISSTMSGQIDGSAQIAAKVALKRVQDAAKAKHAKLLASLNGTTVNKTA